MIPELIQFTILAVLAICALIPLAEEEKLEEWSEKRHVNRLADRSRKRKAQEMRNPCRYAQAYIRPGR